MTDSPIKNIKEKLMKNTSMSQDSSQDLNSSSNDEDENYRSNNQ